MGEEKIVLIKPQHGHKLMIKIILLKLNKKEEGPCLRKIIFRTKCKSREMCCKMIIDG
jgi:hypothetical protein